MSELVVIGWVKHGKSDVGEEMMNNLEMILGKKKVYQGT